MHELTEQIKYLAKQLDEKHSENVRRLDRIEETLSGKKTWFLDGCHRYSWLISPVLSALMSAALFAYFIGGVNMSIDSMKKDIELLKNQVFELAHITRGDGSEHEQR